MTFTSCQARETQPRETRHYEHVLDAFDGARSLDMAAGKAAEDTHHTPQPILQAVVLGAPGAGKSTTLNRLAAGLAQRALDGQEQPLPVLVDLAGWIDPVPAADAAPDEEARVAAYLGDLLRFVCCRVPSLGAALGTLAASRRLL